MTLIKSKKGRLPMNLGDYDQLIAQGKTSFAKKNRVNRYGCEWESLMENNTYPPATLVNNTVVPDTSHWRIVSGIPANYSLEERCQATITDGAKIGLGFGSSSDTATTQARTATIANFLLMKNMPVTIRFVNAVNVFGATLNISSTGAKPIIIDSVAVQPGVIKKGSIVTLIYDGTNWNIIGILEVTAAPSDLVVDMGLPSGLLWAKKNIDITQANGFAASEFQNECTFFSWGNTEGHNPVSSSSFGSYSFGSGNNTEPYVSSPGAKLTGNISASFDFARANLGVPWRLPTTEEFEELFTNIDFVQADGETVIDATNTNKLVTINGIKGIYLKSKTNGNTLFFPSSGLGADSSWLYHDNHGCYWSSSIWSAMESLGLRFYENGIYILGKYPRFEGFVCRAVQ